MNRWPRLSEIEIVQRAEVRREVAADFRRVVVWAVYGGSLVVLASVDVKAAAVLLLFGAVVYVYRSV